MIGAGEVVLQRPDRRRPLGTSGCWPVGTVALLVEDRVGIENLAPHEADRVFVGDEVCAKSGVDGKVDSLQRREQELGLTSGEAHDLRQRAQAQERLMALAELGLDPEPSPHDVDRRVEQPEHVGFQRPVARSLVII